MRTSIGRDKQAQALEVLVAENRDLGNRLFFGAIALLLPFLGMVAAVQTAVGRGTP